MRSCRLLASSLLFLIGGCAVQPGDGGILGTGIGVDTRSFTSTEIQHAAWPDGSSVVLRRAQDGTYQVKASNTAMLNLGRLQQPHMVRADMVQGTGVVLLSTGNSCGDGYRLLRHVGLRWDMWILSNCHGPVTVSFNGTGDRWTAREQAPAGQPYTQWVLDQGRLTHTDVLPRPGYHAMRGAY